MKVGFLTSSYPDRDQHPRGIFIHRLARSLVDLGLQVTVVAPGSDRAPETEIREGVKVRRLSYWWRGGQKLTRDLSGIAPTLQSSPWLSVQLAPLFGRMALAATNLGRNCDLVHAHWLYPAGLAASLVHHDRSVPLLVTSHGGDLALARRFAPLRWVAKTVVRHSAACIAVSPLDRNTLQSWMGTSSRVEFLPVGIPAGEDVPELERVSDDADARTFARWPGLRILYVGSLVRRKSVHTILEALGELQEQAPDVACAIVGAGPERARLQQKADSMELANLWFTGSRPPKEVASWMKAADVFVLASESEPWGSVVPEAMAVGTPVVVSETAGSAMLITEGRSGFTFAERDKRQLARHLETIRSMPEAERAEMGASAQREVEDHGVTEKAIARRHLALYRDLLSRGEGGRE